MQHLWSSNSESLEIDECHSGFRRETDIDTPNEVMYAHRMQARHDANFVATGNGNRSQPEHS